MNRRTYRAARRLLRDNGRYALRWLPASSQVAMDRLFSIQDATDPLAERADIVAYCARESIPCTIRHTSK